MVHDHHTEDHLTEASPTVRGEPVDYQPLIIERQIEWYIRKLHAAAEGISGKLIAMAIWPAQAEGKSDRTAHARFSIGDVSSMAARCMAWAKAGANVYTSWAVYRHDTPAGSRGGAKNVVKVLGLVADRDADDGKAGERVVEPTIEVISSQEPARNTNEVLVFAEPLDPEKAIPIGRGLRAAMGADSGTGDIVRLTRISGTINEPSPKKIQERGRPSNPQAVILGDGGTNEPISVSDLIAAIEAKTGRKIDDIRQVQQAAHHACGAHYQSGEGRSERLEQEGQAVFETLPAFVQRKLTHNDLSDRSAHSYNVVMLLFERGLTDAQVNAVLLMHPDGAGKKYIDRADLDAEIVRCRTKWENSQDARPASVSGADTSSVRQSTSGRAKSISDPPWPEMDAPLLYGITGDIVGLATANSEADPAAVAMTHLVWAGAAFGRVRFVRIGDKHHHARLMGVCVGDSSRARKGTSTDGVKRLWETSSHFLCGAAAEAGVCEPPNLKVSPGPMSTGEGIIYEIRDGVDDPNDDKADPGVADKRLFIVEGEFGVVLKVAERTGNTLSAVLRSAWDGSDLAPITKTSRTSATAPHVCFVGHITSQELNALLSSTDVWNGFANRLLWMAARRSKLVPLPKPMPDEDVDRIAEELACLTVHGHTLGNRGGEVILSNHAADYWAHIYPELTQDHPGIFGVITARAEAQVIRLALTYALLDGKEMIDEHHIEAALACWRYSADSVRLIFGDADPDPDANKILNALKNGPMKQSEIGKLFSGHKIKAQLIGLLERLEAAGRVQSKTQETRGRSVTIWSLGV